MVGFQETSYPEDKAARAAFAIREIPDFALDVLPVLTRVGCNAGACHGSAKGQGGFRLSLLGYDADADHEALALELRSRRVNRARPAESLMLLKPTGKVSHGGGRVLKADSPEVALLRDWIAAGAPRKTRDETLVAIEATREIRVTARYSNGAARDVTKHALYSTNDDAVATVSADGAVNVRGKGRTAIVVRYGGHVVPVLVGAPYGEKGEFKPANVVDEHLARVWREMEIAPAPPAADHVLVRRMHLDVLGVLPERGATVDVDALLARPEFVAFWSRKLGVPVDARLDDVVRKRITGDAAFAPSDDPRLMMEHTIQSQHGFRMQCANCHNHPLERFTQDQYHELSAFYARVRVDKGRVVAAPRGELTHPRTLKAVAPRLPDGTVASDGDRRAAFAEWLVKDRRFARAWANRIWGEVFGRGIVHPVDDMRASNPPLVPELLEALAEEFAKDPRVRPFVRLLLTSKAYALASGAGPLLSRAIIKPLPPDVLAGAIERVTGQRPAPHPSGLRQALELMKIDPPALDVEELYWRALSRAPSEAERKLPAGADLVWAVLASKEFNFRH